MEQKAIMYLDRGLVGYDAWVFYGFISFGARLFGSRDWDRGRAVDGHNCIFATPNQPTIRLQTLAMASRPSAPAATTSATTKPAPGVGRWKPRAAFGQRVGLQTKGSAYTRPGLHTAKASLRKEFLLALARQERTRRWANQ
jgi:hypothetical protein